jgi:hypothetical protein
MSNHAIIIGINNYTPVERQGLITLNGAIRDAESVHKWVTTRGGVDNDNAHLIISNERQLTPVKDLIDDTIGEIINNVNAEGGVGDRFYFYFAGHGLGVENDRENNGLCMANWDENKRDSAALSSGDYKRKFVIEGLFKEIVVWLDCCRNPRIYFNPAGAGAITPRPRNANPKWMLAFGTQYLNQAFETSGEARGIFTQVLLEGLDVNQGNGGAPVSVDDLRDYLAYRVPIEAQNAGYTQTPEIFSNVGGRLNNIYF